MLKLERWPSLPQWDCRKVVVHILNILKTAVYED